MMDEKNEIQIQIQRTITELTTLSTLLRNNNNTNTVLNKKEQPVNKTKSYCTICGVELYNPEHKLCYTHWKEKNEEIQNSVKPEQEVTL